jgi:glycosyltransferase involved in cell wall biosynthesis
MTAAPTWSILVPTLGERRPLFERLMAGLLPQTEPYGGRVRVVGWHNDGSPSLPKIRQSMVLGSTTDYVCFVDDDDLVSPDYVDKVVTALGERPDYVGFQVQCYSDGAPIAVAYHSLEHRSWRNLRGRFERDISHINPIRTALARQASFTVARTGMAEDRVWANQLRRMHIVRTQVVVPQILYHYLYVPKGSRWERPRTIQPGERAIVNHPNFSWSPDA